MFLEGIESEDLCKIRSRAGNKKDSGVDKEKKLEEVYGKKYRIRLDHQILTDHGFPSFSTLTPFTTTSCSK